jgi:hypothetical protein
VLGPQLLQQDQVRLIAFGHSLPPPRAQDASAWCLWLGCVGSILRSMQVIPNVQAYG